jgi:hypothetical protein
MRKELEGGKDREEQDQGDQGDVGLMVGGRSAHTVVGIGSGLGSVSTTGTAMSGTGDRGQEGMGTGWWSRQ